MVEGRELDAVLFDFGGVLGGNPGGIMAGRIAEFGLTRDRFMSIALGPLDDDTDHPWHAAERGEITLEQFVARIEPFWRAEGLTAFPEPPGVEEFVQSIRPIPEMVAVARDARAAGYRTAIVSNMVADWAVWRTIIGADELVDVVVDSADVGLRKPAPEIYRLALERLGVAADRALFLDDFPWNITGAEAVGLNAMHVTDPIAAAAELRARLDV
ncbi:MAG: HAD-IA family hydrolase [Ilumatobacter sp.]|uniref:HAD-IA family hydrolase n=1 Tax=Ilumatobacter sp. TaxID=1967498 RepID=UPI00260596DB|nr:HAD-IA family hydrolase [Ilumatobacter sp.]MDJ0770039.1 HAD-IA family hydrolase [Ilumatobacter sp.]